MSLSTHTAQTIVNTAIFYKYKISSQSKIIYITVLMVVAGILAALPFIKVQISVRSTAGYLQPAVEKQQLYAPITGRITQLMIKDNQKIKQGDTLLLMDASAPKMQNNILQTQLSQLNQNLQDVNRIIQALNQNANIKISDLQTGQYQASWQQYVQELKNNHLAKEQAERTYKRYEILYHNKVLTAAEFEKYKLEMEQAQSNWVLVEKNYKSRCQADANKYQNDLREFQKMEKNYSEQEKQLVLRAPVSGSIQNMGSLHAGAYLIGSQKVAEISPEGSLLAYCYIKPSEIGLIHSGQDARFQIDAFNYNQWGLLTGKIIDISDDILVFNNQPFFKIKCSLDKNYLQLKNGYKGYLKKGMSLSARFTVAERSLYQLLYDKVDDWINPKQTSSSSQKALNVPQE